MTRDDVRTKGALAIVSLAWWISTGSTPAWVCLNAVMVGLALGWFDEYSGRG